MPYVVQNDAEYVWGREIGIARIAQFDGPAQFLNAVRLFEESPRADVQQFSFFVKRTVYQSAGSVYSLADFGVGVEAVTAENTCRGIYFRCSIGIGYSDAAAGVEGAGYIGYSEEKSVVRAGRLVQTEHAHHVSGTEDVMLFVVLHEGILQTDLVSGKAYIQLYFPVVAPSGFSAKAYVGYADSGVEFLSGMCVPISIDKKSSS